MRLLRFSSEEIKIIQACFQLRKLIIVYKMEIYHKHCSHATPCHQLDTSHNYNNSRISVSSFAVTPRKMKNWKCWHRLPPFHRASTMPHCPDILTINLIQDFSIKPHSLVQRKYQALNRLNYNARNVSTNVMLSGLLLASIEVRENDVNWTSEILGLRNRSER